MWSVSGSELEFLVSDQCLSVYEVPPGTNDMGELFGTDCIWY